MICFQHFTAPLWEVFTGNLLLLFCSLFYLTWWVVSFRPGSTGGPAGSFCIAAAFVTGMGAIALLATGISALAPDSKGLRVRFILLGAVVLFVALLLVTSAVFHRQVTSELLIMHIWAALELSAVAVLYGTGRFGAGRTAVLAALVGVATVVGVICYVLYYRLDGTLSYRVGMVPLATDAVVMAVFLSVLAAS